MPFLAPVVSAIGSALGGIGGAVATGATAVGSKILGGLKSAGNVLGSSGAASGSASEGGSFWGNLLKGGISLGGGALISKLLNAKTDEERAAILNQLAAQEKLSGLGDVLQSRVAPAIDPAVGYWQRLLSGSRGEMVSAAAPEISAIGEGYRGAFKSLAELSPRSGGRTALISELPFRQARDITSLLQRARPEAAENLASAGTNLASLASSAYGGGTTAAGNLLLYGQKSREAAASSAADIGDLLWTILNSKKG